MTTLIFAVLLAVCLPASRAVEYGVAYPAYSPPATYYPPPTYYDTYDIKTDYRDANLTSKCGVLPTVHRPEGYEYGRASFGEYPWQVAILDDYQTFKCSGGILTGRYIITSAQCVAGLAVDKIRVRIGEYDMLTDKNYVEVLKNYEATVCKKHPYYNVPKPSYGYGYQQDYSAYNYDVVILELTEDLDLDVYPHATPICIPDFYDRTNTYYTEYTYGYGGKKSASPASSDRNEIGSSKDLECWVAGWQESPKEKFSYKESKPQYQGYSYQPNYYESYEYSQVLFKAKVKPSYDYYPATPSYGYGKSYKTESWDAEYYYDTCHGDVGAPIFCLVGEYFEQEKYPSYYPTYTPSYPSYPSYSPPSYPSYTPSYPSYKAKRSPVDYYPSSYPSYTPSYPSYTPSYPSYTPSYPSYTPSYPTYEPSYPSYTPAYPSYTPSYPTYEPSYPSYTPSYPTYAPAYPAPSYEEKFPIREKEKTNLESRRAVLFGVVSYGTSCSTYGYGYSKKITATPIREILDWVYNVMHTPPSCYSYSYTPSYPAYEPSYPTYTPSYPTYEPSYPTYTPSYPAYEPSYPTYTPSYPAYEPSYPSYAPSYPSYSPY